MRMQRQTLVLLLCCCMTGYFGFHAIHGKHGLDARRGLQERAALLARELQGLETVRAALRHEVALLDPVSPDPGFVEELARSDLAFARPGERILLEHDPRMASLR
ncbi:MAG: septum formation initiator family protein [Hyphomicrobiaceae bacterium]